jgi:4-diphosphocytidyl-2-C-methyl-D-erythritol kinase
MLLSALAYAKVNLYLKVLGKRDDGLHDLDMVMQSVSLADKISVDTDCDGISVACDGIADDDNIVTAAAKAYFRRAEIADGRAAFVIEKNIPVLAGLGGGSADAAAALRLLNRMYNRLNEDELLKLAGEIGSDVPFCMTGGTARVKGFGEKVSPIENRLDYRLVFVKAGEKKSTGHMFGLIDSSDEHIGVSADDLAECIRRGDRRASEFMQNDFAKLWHEPRFDTAFSRLNDSGADTVCLSGSGPTVFALFYDKETSEQCFNTIKNDYPQSYLCAPVSHGVKIIE